MEHYVTLERAIACPRASVAVAAETAAQVLASAGYRRGLGFGPTQSYVRAYRPTWAVALAVLLAVPTAGLALLLLLVRSKDHCNVVIEDGPYGVVALVSGRVPASLPAQLEAATGSYPDQGGSYPEAGQQPPQHMLLTPSGGYEGPSAQQSAILRPATPIPGLFPGAPAPAGHGGGHGGGHGYPPGSPGGQGYQPGYDGQRPPPPPSDPGRYPHPPVEPYPLPPAAQAQPGYDENPVPGPHRPPSRLAPPLPSDAPAGAGPNGSGQGNPAAPNGRGGSRQGEDDPFSSTSGRVPWAVAGAGTSRPPMPAPAGPPPVSPGAWSPSGAPLAAPAPPAAPLPPAPARHGGGQPQPGGVVTAVSSRYVLRVDSGEVLELSPFCLLGREPMARDGDPPATLVRFDDSKLSVSKTHIAYGVDDNGLWVMDRNSTNGTTIIDPGGQRIPCSPGAREYLQIGSQVQIGQRRFTVEGPEGAAG